MAKRTTGGTLAAICFIVAIIAFAVGAYFGTQSGNTSENPSSGSTGQGTETSTSSDDQSAPALTLKSENDSVSSGDRINLSGTLTPAEKDIKITLQRKVGEEEWGDFPIDPMTTDENGNFSSWVQSGQKGTNSFRVIKTDDNSIASEPIDVTIN